MILRGWSSPIFRATSQVTKESQPPFRWLICFGLSSKCQAAVYWGSLFLSLNIQYTADVLSLPWWPWWWCFLVCVVASKIDFYKVSCIQRFSKPTFHPSIDRISLYLSWFMLCGFVFVWELCVLNLIWCVLDWFLSSNYQPCNIF